MSIPQQQYLSGSWLFKIMFSRIPDYCAPTSTFLAYVSSSFHTCIPTPLALLSTTLGYLSILSWLFAQAPQIVKNYNLKSASGLSPYFLAIWFLGDTSNLLGALLTGQALWQVLVAAYYVSVDVMLVSQYIWYTPFRSTPKKELNEDNGGHHEDGSDHTKNLTSSSSAEAPHDPDKHSVQAAREARNHTTDNKAIAGSMASRNNSSQGICEKPPYKGRVIRSQKSSLPASTPPNAILLVSVLCAVLVNASPITNTATFSSSPQPRPSDELEFAGRIFSWISTALYLGSRLPQLYKNFSRRSTAGLSPILFIAAFFGNLFYSTSLLMDPLAWSSYPPYGDHGWAGPEGSDQITWIKLSLPFWLGSAGVLAMDAAMGVQFLKYREVPKIKIVLTKDERGRSKWRKVSGWMRGWIPSPSPARSVEAAGHDHRPLLAREEESTRYGST